MKEEYISLSEERLTQESSSNGSVRLAVQDDARNIPHYLEPESVSLIWTSPPYSNLLNRKRMNN